MLSRCQKSEEDETHLRFSVVSDICNPSYSEAETRPEDNLSSLVHNQPREHIDVLSERKGQKENEGVIYNICRDHTMILLVVSCVSWLKNNIIQNL